MGWSVKPYIGPRVPTTVKSLENFTSRLLSRVMPKGLTTVSPFAVDAGITDVLPEAIDATTIDTDIVLESDATADFVDVIPDVDLMFDAIPTPSIGRWGQAQAFYDRVVGKILPLAQPLIEGIAPHTATFTTILAAGAASFLSIKPIGTLLGPMPLATSALNVYSRTRIPKPSEVSSSYHEIPALERLEYYSLIPLHLRTAHTERMLEVGEILSYFETLTLADITDQSVVVRKLAQELIEQTFKIVDLYVEDRLLPIFGVARLLNEAYQGHNSVAVRFDFDVGILNLLDETGSLGDEYVPLLGDWLLKHLSNNNEAFTRFNGHPPTVVRLPERTSFLIIGSNGATGQDLIDFVMSELVNFKSEMFDALSIAQKKDRISEEVDLHGLKLSATIHYTTLQLQNFMDGYMAEHGVEEKKFIPRRVIIDHIHSELRRLAGETIFFKAYPPTTPIIAHSGLTVYNDTLLPPESDFLYDSLRTYVDEGRGFVPFGRFGYHVNYEPEPDPRTRAHLEFPDIPHNLGDIYREGGGAVVDFWKAVDGVITNPSPENFRLLRNYARGLALLVLNIGEEGRHDFRYPATMKSTRFIKGEPADFFTEQVGMLERIFAVKYDVISAIEVDDASTFTREHPPNDLTDSEFQHLKLLIFKVADKWNLYPPVVAAEGDQIRMAFVSKTAAGEPLDVEGFLKDYQLTVHSYYEDRPIHPVAKVETLHGLRKLPIWIHPETGELKVAPDQPMGFDRFSRTMTVTISYTDLPQLDSPEDVRQATEAVRLMFKYIGLNLKSQRGEFLKEGFGRLPKDFRNGEVK